VVKTFPEGAIVVFDADAEMYAAKNTGRAVLNYSLRLRKKIDASVGVVEEESTRSIRANRAGRPLWPRASVTTAPYDEHS